MTQPRDSRPARPQGFTLMEVLVAMTITLAVLFAAMWIFSSTHAMVKSGLEKSEISSGVAYFDTHLREDVKGFVGPIPQKALTGSPSADLEGGALIIVPGMREGMIPDASGVLRRVDKLRCDQMVFFYGVNSPALPSSATALPRIMTTMNPAAKDTQDVNGNGDTGEPALSGQARIWYGHVRRLGGEETAVDPASGKSYEVAHHWILGRQAMLLLPPAAGVLQCDSLLPTMAADTATYGDKSGGNNLNALQLFANTARGMAGTRAPNDPLASASAPNQYKGLLGAADKLYLDMLIPGGSAAHCNDDGADRLHESSQPLINTMPLADGKLTAGDLFASHMQAVPNCSECIIQFAADLDKDGKVDTESDGNGGQRIIWYPRDAEVFNPGAGLGIPGPFVFRADDWQSRTVRYPYKQDGRCYTNKYGDQFPYPWSPVGKAFSGYYYDMLYNEAWRVAANGNGRLYRWPAVYADPNSAPDTATVHGGHSTNFGDGLDPGWNGTDHGSTTTDNPTVLPGDLPFTDAPKISPHTGPYSTDFGGALVGNGVAGDEMTAYAQLLTDYPQDADAGWRQRVSDWPWMIRIRLRVHDASGKCVTHNDDLPANGRDDDGNGKVDDADGREGRASGYWSEHIFAVPRPRWFK